MMVLENKEVCILCGRKAKSRKPNNAQIKSARKTRAAVEQLSALLLPQLRVIYLLDKVFGKNVQSVEVWELLGKLGDPVNWMGLCESCEILANEGIDCWRELKRLEVKHKNIVRKLVERSRGLVLNLSELAVSIKVCHGEEDEVAEEITIPVQEELTVEDYGQGIRVKTEVEEEEITEDANWSPGNANAEEDDNDKRNKQEINTIEPLVNELSVGNPISGEDVPTPVVRLIKKKMLPIWLLRKKGRRKGQKKSEILPMITTGRTDNLSLVVPDSIKTSEKKKDCDELDWKAKLQSKRRQREKPQKYINYGVDSDEEEVAVKKPRNKKHPDPEEANLLHTSSDAAEKDSREKHNTRRKKSYSKPVNKDSDSDWDEDNLSSSSDDHNSHNIKNTKLTNVSTTTNKISRTKTNRKLKPLTVISDYKLFYDKCWQYLDLTLLTYPPVTPEHYSAIPTIEPGSSQLQIKEEGQESHGSYPCPSCSKCFQTSYYTLAHLHRCHLSIARPWRCPYCTKRTAHISALRTHLHNHKFARTLKCKICKKFYFRSKRALDIHVIRHFKDCSQRQCPECPENDFINYKQFIRHMRLEHSYHDPTANYKERQFVCELCSQPVKNLKYLEFHKVTKHGEVDSSGKFPICGKCGKLCISKTALEHHVNDIHTSGTCVCEQCGMACKSEGALKTHLRYGHAEWTPELCKLCGMELTSFLQKHRHNQSHKEVKGMTEEEIEGYKRRMWEEMGFSCRYCGEKFAFGVLQYHHEREMHPEITGKFKCDVCGKGFSRVGSVKRHKEMVHEGMEVKCEMCGKEYKSREVLTQHLKRGACKGQRQNKKGNRE